MLHNMKQKMLKLPGYSQENIFENWGNPSGSLSTPCLVHWDMFGSMVFQLQSYH